ncbi:cytochrome c oxidase assembly protein [Nesterenkonia jeotgali]|uniref:Copper resistance protein CopD n=1 Tax=Nesterenkonia jeotgali TaxID=317018 RepID=A0A0W8IF92_9MICC|nr:cytochrome c oxidase assembly protein [Nesterenkonia jeotgali]KUG58589.1 copper resistance protein CopD [Nesterenkonia jeotgali]
MSTSTPTLTSGIRVWTAPLPLTAAALCAGLLALIVTGVLSGSTAPSELSDPGALTRWGLPVARFIHHLAMATAIAAVILAAVAVPPQAGPRRRRKLAGEGVAAEHPLFTRTMQIAGLAGVVWTVAAVAVLVLTFSSLSGLALSSSDSFAAGFFDYVQSIPTGQAWAAVVLIAAVFATLVTAVRAPAGLFFIAVLGLTAIVPMALVGHSASGDDHYAAVNSLGLHLLGVVIWVGGLVVLALLSPALSRDAAQTRVSAAAAPVTEAGPPSAEAPATPAPGMTETLLRRYSTLAGLALITVAASGVINASLRIETLEQLTATSYGLMISAKLLATLALAGIGWMHRSWIIPRLGSGARPSGLLFQLILVEIAIMAAVIGISAILGRTAPPVPEDLPPDATPARTLTGYDLPPEPTGSLWLTLWRPDWLWVAVVVFLAAWYLLAMVRLRRRGDSWSVLRTASWLFGLLVLLWVTSGGPAVYGTVLFSGHMIQHMTLTMVAPLFMVMGSPVTLALRALDVRTDGTRGPREWILWLVHSRFSKVITHPIVAAVNFAGSLLIFYYTPVFGLVLEYHVGHELMIFHFLATGYIFALVLIGQDPLPARPAHPMRLIILLATMVFHAFLAVAMTSSDQLIQAAWFGNMGHDWGFTALEDQRSGGELMWALGEIPAILMSFVAGVIWSRDDKRETKRLDREADRTGDAELNDYNDMFAQMAERDGPR